MPFGGFPPTLFGATLRPCTVQTHFWLLCLFFPWPFLVVFGESVKVDLATAAIPPDIDSLDSLCPIKMNRPSLRVMNTASLLKISQRNALNINNKFRFLRWNSNSSSSLPVAPAPKMPTVFEAEVLSGKRGNITHLNTS